MHYPARMLANLDRARLALLLLLSTVVFFAVEAEKWCVRRGLLYRVP